jgi:hypothetical protein
MKEEKQPHGGMLLRPEKGETNNPNGRPKKSFSLMNETLKKEGYEPLTKGQLMEAYSLLYSLNESRISELAEDETQPLAIRLIIQEMTEPQSRGKALNDMRDYLFGKAREELKIIEEQPLFPDAN